MAAFVLVSKYAPIFALMGGFAAAAQEAPVAPPAAATQVAATLAPEKNLCASRAEPVAVGSVQWNGWGRDLSNTRYQPEPAIRAMDVPKLALKWAFGFQAGAEFGQPALVDGRLFAASSTGRVYALDAKSGCTYWTFDAPAGSRTAISIGELGQAKRAAIPRKLKRTLAHLEVIKAPSAGVFRRRCRHRVCPGCAKGNPAVEDPGGHEPLGAYRRGAHLVQGTVVCCPGVGRG